MTAPLLNLPITSPVPGAPSAKVAGQSPAAGFEALLSALFGPPKVEGAAPLPPGQPQTGGVATTDVAAAIVEEPEEVVGEAQPIPSQDQASAPADTLVFAMAIQPAPAQDQAAAPADTRAFAMATQPAPSQEATQPKDTGEAAASAGRTAAAPEIELPPVEPATDQAAVSELEAIADPAAPMTADNAGKPASAFAPTPEVKPQPTTSASPARPEASTQPEPAQTTQPAQASSTVSAGPAALPPAPAAPAPLAALAQASAEAPAPIETEAEPAEPADAAPVTPTRKAQGTGAAPPAAPAERMPVEAPVTAAAGRTAVAADTAGKPAAAVQPDTRAEVEPALDAPDAPQPTAAPAAPVQAQAAAHGAAPVRATPETVASLTAHIVKNLEGRTTKFDVELNPAGLGQVNVSVEIAASGKMTAAMSFDSPQAAAELRARSHELQKALEQAGFDVSAGGLSFDVAGDRGGDGRHLAQQHQDQNDGAAWRGRAFQAVLGTAGEVVETAASAALQYARRTDSGVDIRI